MLEEILRFYSSKSPCLPMSSPISPLQTTSCFQGMHIQPVLEEVVDYGPQISSLRPGHPALQVLPKRTDTGSEHSAALFHKVGKGSNQPKGMGGKRVMPNTTSRRGRSSVWALPSTDCVRMSSRLSLGRCFVSSTSL